MLDLRQTVIESLDALIESKAIEKCVAATLEKTVQKVIEEQLASYSEFGKQIKELVAKSLAINGDVDLPSYNDAILKVIRQQLQHATESTIQQQVAARLKDLLEPPPAQITLSKLVDQYKEWVKDRNDAGCVCYGEGHEITVHIHESTPGFRYIELDDEPDKKRHQCDICIGVHRDEVFSLKFQNANVEKEMFVGPLYGFERMLFQMKAAKSKLLIDVCVDELDLCYGAVD